MLAVALFGKRLLHLLSLSRFGLVVFDLERTFLAGSLQGVEEFAFEFGWLA